MKVLLLNQCFHPDVVSASQHLTDFAMRLADEGHDVTVLASRRGYDDATARFASRETWKGIEIIRIPSLNLGKKSKLRRSINFASFLAACVLRLMLLPRHDVVVGMTAPPLISFLAALFVQLKGGRFVYWVMDLNPDEAIAAGWLRERSVAARTLHSILVYALRRAERIIVLDRFMKERILAKGISGEKIDVVPPWSHDDAVKFDIEGREAFRQTHDLTEKFVVMYSGNHSPCHPLDTLLYAAQKLKDNSDVKFCFVGGGSEFAKVKRFAAERGLKNILCLPYQPLDKLSASLSAADLHVVVMGDEFAGIVHPCKIYNILSVGAPFLYIGPTESHVIDILPHLPLREAGRTARHGDVEKVVAHIYEAMRDEQILPLLSEVEFSNRFSMGALLPRMVEAIEAEPRASLVRGLGASNTSA